MNVSSLQKKLSFPVGEVMAALLVAQPLLDVLSYFMGQADATWLTTALRTVLLFAVGVYGFSVTENRRAYYVMYGVVGGFWVLHMLSCLRLGYQDPVGDAAEYLKLVQFPLWTLSFVTFFRQRRNLDYRVAGLLAVNVGLILLVIALSYAVGQPVYTYDYPERGVAIGILGWFGVANSQSSILTLLVPPLLLWGLRSQRLWQFCLCCVGGFGLLYFTGTRLTYYGAILIGCAFLALLLLRRQQLLFCVPLAVAVVALVACRGISPMVERQALTGDSYAPARGGGPPGAFGENHPGVHRGVRPAGHLRGDAALGPHRRVWPGGGDGAVQLRHRPPDLVQHPGEEAHGHGNGVAKAGLPDENPGL